MSSSERVPEIFIADEREPIKDASFGHLKQPKRHFQRVVPGELQPIRDDVAERVLDYFNVGETSKKIVALKTMDREVTENPVYTAERAAIKAFAPFAIDAPNFARPLARVIEEKFSVPNDKLAASLGAMGVLTAFDLADDSDGRQNSFAKTLNRFHETEWGDILTSEINEVRSHLGRGIFIRSLEGLEFPIEQANLHKITYKLFFVSPTQDVTFDIALATFKAINRNWGNLNKSNARSRTT